MAVAFDLNRNLFQSLHAEDVLRVPPQKKHKADKCANVFKDATNSWPTRKTKSEPLIIIMNHISEPMDIDEDRQDEMLLPPEKEVADRREEFEDICYKAEANKRAKVEPSFEEVQEFPEPKFSEPKFPEPMDTEQDEGLELVHSFDLTMLAQEINSITQDDEVVPMDFEFEVEQNKNTLRITSNDLPLALRNITTRILNVHPQF